MTSTVLLQQLLGHPGNPLPDWLFAAQLDSWLDHAMPRSHMALARRLSQVGGVILPLEDIRLLVSELHPISLLRSGSVYRPSTPLTSPACAVHGDGVLGVFV